MPRVLDEYSGNLIRKTDNGPKPGDMRGPQDPDILEVNPKTKLPVWWENIKGKKKGDGTKIQAEV